MFPQSLNVMSVLPLYDKVNIVQLTVSMTKDVLRSLNAWSWCPWKPGIRCFYLSLVLPVNYVTNFSDFFFAVLKLNQ